MPTTADCNQSADGLSDDMYAVARKDGMTTIYERVAAQQPQCAFGMRGRSNQKTSQ